MIAVEQGADTPQAPEREPAATPLRRGDTLRCPFCGRSRREWDYPRLRTPPEYRHELRPVLRCPSCLRHFAPAGMSE